MYPEQECKQLSLIERLREGWFPPAAIAGAFSAFVAAVFRSRPAAKGDPRPAVDSFRCANKVYHFLLLVFDYG
jgi:hypothetical protein